MITEKLKSVPVQWQTDMNNELLHVPIIQYPMANDILSIDWLNLLIWKKEQGWPHG